jgi:predicted negative regulator of RcsB-dependent stress response
MRCTCEKVWLVVGKLLPTATVLNFQILRQRSLSAQQQQQQQQRQFAVFVDHDEEEVKNAAASILHDFEKSLPRTLSWSIYVIESRLE